MRAMVAISLVGGLLGALLLMNTPSRAFDFIVPWLLLIGSLAFTFGKQAGAWLRRRVQIGRTTLLIAQGARQVMVVENLEQDTTIVRVVVLESRKAQDRRPHVRVVSE